MGFLIYFEIHQVSKVSLGTNYVGELGSCGECRNG